MTSKPDDLPSDLASAYLALLAEREALQAERDVAVADAANARAELSDSSRNPSKPKHFCGPKSQRQAQFGRKCAIWRTADDSCRSMHLYRPVLKNLQANC
ncbi:hypothetical protein [Bradyrhizobium sp. Ghvi]|uniref:hypothetical protein n=1 Tax=Bradyrhizobium sp. Ghvi TaxID=1855319 RepID=UPI000B1C8B7B|nr:hypothetical protein [Bradyrhizobium sp. Ghvi]